MIIFFRFQNYYSFRHNTLINLQAGIYKEHPDHLAKNSKGNLLKTLAIYGPNSSGKTRLIEAIAFFCCFIRRQLGFFFPFPPENCLNPQFSLIQEAFHYPETSLAPLSMSMAFSHCGFQFEYGFTLEHSSVTEEYFLCDGTLLFQKSGETLTPGKSVRNLFKKNTFFKTSGSGLAFLFSWSFLPCQEALSAFADFFQNRILFFPNRILFLPQSFSGPFSIRELLSQEEKKRFIFRHLKALDLPCSSQALSASSPATGLHKTILFLDCLFRLLPHGGVLLSDDFTAFLHPNISQYVIRLFQGPENHSRQLIFTTHDTALLNRKQFRRDEAAMVNLDSKGCSRIHTLADIHIRFDASFAKDYLSGKYGNLPIWEEEEQS